jgi:hypothetical protein
MVRALMGPPRDTPDEEQAPAPVEAPPSTLLPRAYRLTGIRPSSRPPPGDEPLLRAIADVLLAAAP